MKQLSLIVAFVSAGWLIAVSAYTMYAVVLVSDGFRPSSLADCQKGLVGALNYAFPLAIGCMLFLRKIHSSSPVSRDLFVLCMLTCVLGSYLGFKAKEYAFPQSEEIEFVKAIWWLPDPKVS